jgi:hypothetical protein
MGIGNVKIIGVILILSGLALFSQIPPTMNFQGKLTSLEGVGIDEAVDISFRILKNQEPASDSPGDTLWTDTYLEVPITKGLFDVRLGSTTPLDLAFAEQYWVELAIEGEVLYPRIELSSVGYAFRAKFADSTSVINWDTLGAFVDSTHFHNLTLDGDVSATGSVSGTLTVSIQPGAVDWEYLAPAVKDSIRSGSGSDADWQVVGSNMYAIPTGNVGIGTTSPGAKLEVRRQNATSKIRITTDDGTGGGGFGDVYLQYDLAGGGMSPGAYIWTTGIDNSDGQKFKISGASDNAYPGFNDKLTVTGSGRVGIVTTNPNEALTIQGRLSLYETTSPSATADYGKLYVKSSDSKLYFMDDSGAEYELTSSGGDDWGSQVVQTTARLTGDGTTGNEIDIAQQSADTGQVLTWNGASWSPGNTIDPYLSVGKGNVASTSTFYIGKDLKFRWNSSSNTIEASTDISGGEGTWSHEYQTHNSASSLNMNGGDVIISIGSWTDISSTGLTSDWASTNVWISKKNTSMSESYKIDLQRHGSSYSWMVWRIPSDPGPVVFVSSSTYMAGNCTGGLYGYSGACSICMALASSAGLSGTFKAILSDAGGNALNRLNLYDMPYYNLNGDLISPDSAGFWDGEIDNAVGYDENGIARGGYVWTGSDRFGFWGGDGSVNEACSNWGSCNDTYMGGGIAGNATSNNRYWLDYANPGCGAYCRIYCIQVKSE